MQEILKDVEERVSVIPSTSSDIIQDEYQERDEYDGYDEDEEYFSRAKVAKQHFLEMTRILCVWDCSRIWIRVSNVCSFVVFDAFTEVFIALVAAVNIVFMAMDEYEIECDNNNWEDEGYHDGM